MDGPDQTIEEHSTNILLGLCDNEDRLKYLNSLRHSMCQGIKRGI